MGEFDAAKVEPNWLETQKPALNPETDKKDMLNTWSKVDLLANKACNLLYNLQSTGEMLNPRRRMKESIEFYTKLCTCTVECPLWLKCIFNHI